MAQLPCLGVRHKIRVESQTNRINLRVIYIKSKLQTGIFISNYKESVPIQSPIILKNDFQTKSQPKFAKLPQCTLLLCVLENWWPHQKLRDPSVQRVSQHGSEIMTWFKLNKVKNHEILKYLHETSFSAFEFYTRRSFIVVVVQTLYLIVFF